MEEEKYSKKDSQKNLFKHMAESLDFKKIKTSFSRYTGSFSLWLLDGDMSERGTIESELCKRANANYKNKKMCLSNLTTVFMRVEKSKNIEVFECPFKRFGFCIPLIDSNEIIGYLVACQMRNKPKKEMLDLISCFVDITLKEAKKALELDELYKTVKPRAIALSTVHTIHRLITTALTLDELLLRVARLCLQIIKANRCSIKLVDSKKKLLLPKTTVDLREKKTRLKKVKVGKWAPGKAVKYGKSIKGDRYLATPLIDEDVVGVITLYDKIDGEPFNNFDVEIMRTLAEQAAIAIKNAQLYKEQEKLTLGSIKALAQIIESRGPGIYTPKSGFLVLL